MTKRWNIPALMVAALSLGGVAVWAEPNQADLQKQVEQLQAQVKDLQSQRTYSQADVTATVDSIVRDADKRSQLLADAAGGMAGWMDGGFVIQSADGVYSMRPGIQFQFRSVTNYNDMSSGENWDNGFETRRLKFSLEGTAISKNLYYNFVWATSRSSGNLVNEEAYVKYKFADNFAVKAGQFKEHILLETQVSSKRQLAVERSIVSEILLDGDAYSQGIELIYDSQNLQASFGFTDGYNSRNTNFQDPPANSFDWGAHARVQYKAFGDWRDYSDVTAMFGKDLLVIGGGGDWSQNGDIDTFRHGVDVQYETGGKLALTAAYVAQWIRIGGGGDDLYHWGVMVQAAYALDKQWEVFARGAYLDFDSVSDDDTFCEITVGLNYYIYKHNAKITVDLGWLPSGSPTSIDSAGILANDGDNQFYFRAQFQLLL